MKSKLPPYIPEPPCEKCKAGFESVGGFDPEKWKRTRGLKRLCLHGDRMKLRRAIRRGDYD